MAPLAPLNGTIGAPLVPMVMAIMAPMVHPIAIGTIGDRHWYQWRLPLDAIGAIWMAPMVPLESDTANEIAIKGEWPQWNQWFQWRHLNGANDTIGTIGAIWPLPFKYGEKY